MARSPLVVLLATLLLALSGASALGQESGKADEKPEKRPSQSEASETTSDTGAKSEDAARKGDEKRSKSRAEAPTPNQRPKDLVDPRDYPEGVTVLVPRRAGEGDASGYAEGVTVLGPGGPTDDSPRIRVRVEPGAPPPDIPELGELPPPGDTAQGTALGPTGTTEGSTVGPNIGEQQEAFREPPRAGGTLLPPYVGWQPESAYPDADAANPYPWNPSTWIEPVFDNTWEPTSTWPERQDRRNWSPSSWIRPSIDYVWAPTDSWGRSLGIPGPRENQLSGPRDASVPADAATPGDAESPGDAGSAPSATDAERAGAGTDAGADGEGSSGG